MIRQPSANNYLGEEMTGLRRPDYCFVRRISPDPRSAWNLTTFDIF
jgi:hypothetical protein